MLLAFAACTLVWFYIRRASRNLVYELMVFGAAIVYLCIYPDALVYPIDIVVNSDEAYRVSFSFTYPFTMEQYRNYEANLFYYLIRFGSHDGIVLFQFPATPDQGEFIHLQHNFSAGVLGLLTMIGPLLVFILSYIEARIRSPSRSKSAKRIIIPLFLMQVPIVLAMTVLSSIGARFYFAAGLGALILTLHPFIRALRNTDND